MTLSWKEVTAAAKHRQRRHQRVAGCIGDENRGQGHDLHISSKTAIVLFFAAFRLSLF